MRLIDADALKAYLQENYIIYDHSLEDIDAQPTIDAEPIRHGKWLYSQQYGTYCSECGGAAFEIVGEQYARLRTRYCWDCGARMVKDEDAD